MNVTSARSNHRYAAAGEATVVLDWATLTISSGWRAGSIPRLSVVLCLMWFTIDIADGTDSIWFFWPVFGTGVAVAIIAVGLLGIGGLFGAAWERRQVDRYLERNRDPETGG